MTDIPPSLPLALAGAAGSSPVALLLSELSLALADLPRDSRIEAVVAALPGPTPVAVTAGGRLLPAGTALQLATPLGAVTARLTLPVEAGAILQLAAGGPARPGQWRLLGILPPPPMPGQTAATAGAAMAAIEPSPGAAAGAGPLLRPMAPTAAGVPATLVASSDPLRPSGALFLARIVALQSPPAPDRDIIEPGAPATAPGDDSAAPRGTESPEDPATINRQPAVLGEPEPQRDDGESGGAPPAAPAVTAPRVSPGVAAPAVSSPVPAPAISTVMAAAPESSVMTAPPAAPAMSAPPVAPAMSAPPVSPAMSAPPVAPAMSAPPIVPAITEPSPVPALPTPPAAAAMTARPAAPAMSEPSPSSAMPEPLAASALPPSPAAKAPPEPAPPAALSPAPALSVSAERPEPPVAPTTAVAGTTPPARPAAPPLAGPIGPPTGGIGSPQPSPQGGIPATAASGPVAAQAAPAPPPSAAGESSFEITGDCLINRDAGRPLLQTPLGLIALAIPADSLPPGSRVTLVLQPLPRSIDAPPPAAAATPLSRLAQHLSALVASDPAAAATLRARIATPGPGLARHLWLATQATASDPAVPRPAWASMVALTATTEAAAINPALPPPHPGLDQKSGLPADSWQTLVIPLLLGDGLTSLRLSTRQSDDESAAPHGPPERGSRFLVDLELSRWGRLQIDGLAQRQRKRLDLVIRSDQLLPAGVRRDIDALFHANLQAFDLHGALRYQQGFAADPAGTLTPTDNGIIFA